MPKLDGAILATVLALTSASVANAGETKQLGFLHGTTLDSVHSLCKTVSVVPMTVPIFRDVDPTASMRIETAAEHALSAAGFNVVSGNRDNFISTYGNVVQRAGGLYDSTSGTRRVDVMNNAFDAAIRSYTSDSRLDCYVNLNVWQSTATWAGTEVTFDGVTEFADGQRNNAESGVVVGSAGSRSNEAISISLTIYNKIKVDMFNRQGGVQLTTYAVPSDRHRNAQLTVPTASLLQDDKRIERALTFITAPLHYTAAQIEAGTSDPAINTRIISPAGLPKLPAGTDLAANSEHSSSQVADMGIHRVVLGGLSALNWTIAPELGARYKNLMHEHLRKLGWEVIDSDGLDEALRSAQKQIGGIYDPYTGKVDPARQKMIMQTAAVSLGMTTLPDAYVQISLVRKFVTESNGYVEWDGARETAIGLPAESDKAAAGAELVHRLGAPLAIMSVAPSTIAATSTATGAGPVGAVGNGVLGAVSLQVNIVDANGAALFKSHGGVQLLQKVVSWTKSGGNDVLTMVNLTDAELFFVPSRDKLAVDLALKPLGIHLTQFSDAATDHHSDRMVQLDQALQQQNYLKIFQILYPVQLKTGGALSKDEEVADMVWLSAHAESGHVPLYYVLSWKLIKSDIAKSRLYNARARIGVMLDAAECTRKVDNPFYFLLEGRAIENNVPLRSDALAWARSVDDALAWWKRQSNLPSAIWYCGNGDLMETVTAQAGREAYWQKIKVSNDAKLIPKTAAQ